jgi:hypothetical protein
MKTWTKDIILKELSENAEWVYASVVALYNKQIETNNAIGYDEIDAPFMNSLAEQIIKWKNHKTERYGKKYYGTPYSTPLSEKQLMAAKKIIKKYTAQLADIANEKVKESSSEDPSIIH